MPESGNQEVAPFVEDEEECMPDSLNVDQSKVMLCKRQKRDSNAVINRLYIKLKDKSRLKIPCVDFKPCLLCGPSTRLISSNSRTNLSPTILIAIEYGHIH